MSKRIAQIADVALGWALVLAGLAALVLPGPGLLALFAGLALLSRHYEWARRRVRPVRAAALKAAARSVMDWRRLLVSGIGVAAVLAAGVIWIARPGEPHWWPLSETWWLPGGWAAGLTLVVSGIAGLALVAYSYGRFRGDVKPD